MTSVRLRKLSKSYGNHAVLQRLDLQVESGEFVVLVGPSGCGKTTTLRLIAGLERPTTGSIEIAGNDVTRIPPWRREVAMVFQNQAIYPHLSVAENLGFGLRRLGWNRRERRRRVEEIAELLGLARFLERRTAELSGGERQRVAVGRAIARPARVYLFDEPLSSLDAPLRELLRDELANLQQSLRATFLYVTHDPLEAMALGDRLALLEAGQLQQAGPPLELYRHPVNRFVAQFLGMPRMLLAGARVIQLEEGIALEIAGRQVPLSNPLADSLREHCDREVLWGIRAEDFQCQHAGTSKQERLTNQEAVSNASPGGNSPREEPSPDCWLTGRVARVQQHGFQRLVTVTLENHAENHAKNYGTIRVITEMTGRSPDVGDLLQFGFHPDDLHLFDPTTGHSLRLRGPYSAGREEQWIRPE